MAPPVGLFIGQYSGSLSRILVFRSRQRGNSSRFEVGFSSVSRLMFCVSFVSGRSHPDRVFQAFFVYGDYTECPAGAFFCDCAAGRFKASEPSPARPFVFMPAVHARCSCPHFSITNAFGQFDQRIAHGRGVAVDVSVSDRDPSHQIQVIYRRTSHRHKPYVRPIHFFFFCRHAASMHDFRISVKSANANYLHPQEFVINFTNGHHLLCVVGTWEA